MDAGLGELEPELYRELRRLAAAAMRGERPNHTLQPTALVNEAYLRLARSPQLQVPDRGAFLGIAARVMRQVLVEHARARRRTKRGGNPIQVTLGEGIASDPATPFDIVALDEALQRLGEVSPDLVRVIELRYIAGLSVEETAEVLEVSTRTVKRDASLAKRLLFRELGGAAENPGSPVEG